MPRGQDHRTAAMTPVATASNAIAIPARKKRDMDNQSSADSSRTNAFACGSYSSVADSEASPSTSPTGSSGQRRERLMSATFSKADYTVINVGEEERPRLITCVKASQGFDWNQEIFLPSYADYHFDDLERRQDPVEEILVTDEEVQKMFPS